MARLSLVSLYRIADSLRAALDAGIGDDERNARHLAEVSAYIWRVSK